MSKNKKLKEFNIPFSLQPIYNEECNELLFIFLYV